MEIWYLLSHVPAAFEYAMEGAAHMGGVIIKNRVVALDRKLLRGVAGDLGIERNRWFYNRLRIIGDEVVLTMNDGKGATESDEEFKRSIEKVKKQHAE